MRRLFLDITWYGGGDLVAKLPLVVTLPIFTRFFGPEEFGVLSLVLAAVGLLAIVLSFGNEATYARFFFAEKETDLRRSVTTTWFIFVGLFSLAAVIVCLPFTATFSFLMFDSNERALLFVLALLAIPPTLINSLCGQIIRNSFRVRSFVALNLATACLVAGLGLAGVFVFDLGVAGVIGGTLAAAVLLLPLWLITARPPLVARFSLPRLGEMVRYGASLMLAGLAYWIFTTSDRLMLGWLTDFEAVGQYSVAATITMVMSLLVAAFGKAWWPHALALYESDAAQARLFFSRMATYLLAGFGVIALAMATFARDIVVIVSGEAFASGAAALPPLAFAMVAYATTAITTAGMTLTKQVRHVATFAWLAAVLNIGLNVVLIPDFGIVGAAWASLAAMVFLSLGYHMVSQRLWRIGYEYRRLSTTVVLIVVFAAGVGYLPAAPVWLAVPVKLAYLSAFMSLLVLLRVVDVRGIVRQGRAALVRQIGRETGSNQERP